MMSNPINPYRSIFIMFMQKFKQLDLKAEVKWQFSDCRLDSELIECLVSVALTLLVTQPIGLLVDFLLSLTCWTS